ncbi:hypothetical protein PWT90_08098 [Aphanocladium album]|nr:hypothetical protein PWT90_08098 [Aphanocladium album]
MPTHFHSTLSDEDIDDENMRGMDCSQASQGSRSSSARHNAPAVNWQFGNDAENHAFSSAQPCNEQLPETVPIPSQLEATHVEVLGGIESHRRLDYSETCSTARRSSPCNSGFMNNLWDFSNEESNISDLSRSNDAAKSAAGPDEQASTAPKRTKKSKPAKASPRNNSELEQTRTYNTRPRAEISYADGESSSSSSDDSEVDEPPRSAPRPQAKSKKPSPAKNPAPKATAENSPKNRGPAEESFQSESPQTAEKARKRQRPKTPLPMDSQSYIVPSTLPATPPVSTRQAKKRQRRQTRQPAAKKLRRRENEQSKKTSPAVAANNGSVEGDPAQSARPPTNLHNGDASDQHYETAEVPNEAQSQGDQNNDEVTESRHSTERTTPSVVSSPKRISSMQVPIPSHQYESPLPPPPGLNEIQESVEAIPVARPRHFGGLSILMSRDVSQRQEDIVQRIDLHLQGKEKETASVASVYQKNGTSCVDRLHKRFLKERQALSVKLKSDMGVFYDTLHGAKRALAGGAKDRQRIVKELERNAAKRKYSCVNEVNRIKEIAKKVQV